MKNKNTQLNLYFASQHELRSFQRRISSFSALQKTENGYFAHAKRFYTIFMLRSNGKSVIRKVPGQHRLDLVDLDEYRSALYELYRLLNKTNMHTKHIDIRVTISYVSSCKNGISRILRTDDYCTRYSLDALSRFGQAESQPSKEKTL